MRRSPNIVEGHVYRTNRVKVFEEGGLRLWLRSTGGPYGRKGVGGIGAVLQLMQQRPGTRTKYDPLWAGTVRIDETGVTVETTKLRRPPNRQMKRKETQTG
jgi:hypothetical protein